MKWNKHNYDIYSDIRLISSHLNLPKYIERELTDKYFNIVKKIKYTGEKERLIGSILYHITKRDELPITIDQISETLKIEKFSLLRSYRVIMRKLGWRIKPKGRMFYRFLRWFKR